MEPVRIRYWGLLWLTRPTYLVIQSISLVLCVVMMAVGLAGILWSGIILPHWPASDNGGELLASWLALVFWAGLLCLIAEIVEMCMMLRKFTRAEAEQRTKIAALNAVEEVLPAPSASGIEPPPDKQSNTNIQL